MTDRHLLRAERIKKSYGRKKAVDDVSIELTTGEIHVILGRNGSGKTTLAKMLAGMIRPDSGTISPDGIAESTDCPNFRRSIGFLFDKSAHWEGLTGRENAWFFARSFGLSPDQASARLEPLFRDFALDEVIDDEVRTYSYGMRRKLSITECLAHDPRLLIMDEPSIGLDYSARTRLYDILRSKADSGGCVVLSTNDVSEAHIADIVYLMDRGRILVRGNPEELVRSLDGKVMIKVRSRTPPSLDRLGGLPGVTEVGVAEENGAAVLKAMTTGDEEELALDSLLKALAREGASIERIDIERPGLGDVFMRYSEGVE